MSTYDYLFNDAEETFLAAEYAKSSGNHFDIEKIYKQALDIADYFEMPFVGNENDDIANLEGILRGLHVDYTEGRLDGEKLVNAEITFGIFLGQFILENCLGSVGFKWDFKNGIPRLKKDEGNKINPIAKVHKHIVNGDKEDVRYLYALVKKLAEEIYSKR